MANNSEILRILREATLSEAKPVGLVQTDKIIGQSKGENDAYYKDVKKKMSDYEKALTSSMEGAIEEPKFNYENNDEVEYHEYMETLNGMEMLNYERKPSEKFTQRAKEAIEGSSNMGNNPEWANVYPKQKGFTGPDFGKKLVDRIERSKKKRDAATSTFDQLGDDIEEKNVGVNKSKSAYKSSVSKKPVAIGESTIKKNEDPTFRISYWVHNKYDDRDDYDIEIQAKSEEDALKTFRKEYELEAKLARNVTVTDVKNMPIKPRIKQEPNKRLDIPVSPVERKTAPPRIKQEPNKRLDIPVSPVERKTAPPRIKQEPNPISESEVDQRNTHFLVEKSTGKILFAYDYTDEGPEYAKDAIKDMAKDDIRDMGRNPRDIKVMTKQGLIKQGIDPMNMKNWVQSASVDMGENYNKNTNESKMKRLKFKKPFNGVDTALKVIPESYKVDNRVFELTDGNEHYSVRWEGSLTEGKGVVLSSFHQEALNEDVAKIKHLMGFKSQDTLGNLKGGQRLTEDNTFFDMLKKSQVLMTEGNDKKTGKYDDRDGKPEKCDFVPCDDNKSQLSEEAPIMYVYTLDGKMVGTHQYGKGFNPNQLGIEMGFEKNATSIPDKTKMERASKEAHHEKSIEEADVVAGGAQPQQNLKTDVEMLFNTLSKNANLVNKIKKIDNPIEKSQFMVKVAELIDLDLNLFQKTVKELKSQAKQQGQVGENSYLKKK